MSAKPHTTTTALLQISAGLNIALVKTVREKEMALFIAPQKWPSNPNEVLSLIY